MVDRVLADCPPIWRFRARCYWLHVEWQILANEYTSLGVRTQAACCQTLADHFARPFLGQMFTLWEAVVAERTLRRLARHG